MAKLNKPHKWVARLSIIMTGQAISLLGSGLVQFSIIWWLTSKTGSAVVLSLSTIMGLLPMILLSPFAGVAADRFNRKEVMILADGFIALVTLIMSIFLTFGYQKVWMIYILLFLRSAGSAFHQPAFESAMPLIAPKEQLVRVAAITQMLRSGINLVAPMLGIFLIEILPLQTILLFDVVSASLAILSLAAIQMPDLLSALSDHHATVKGYLSDFMTGMRYVYRWKGLLVLIIVFGLSNFLLAPMLSMMPLIISEHFHGSAREYGFFEMAFAVGILIGGLALSVWGGFKRKIISINIAQVICGLILASIVLVPPQRFYLVLLATATCGITSAFINSPATAIFQSNVAKEMQGRVMSIVTMVCMLSMPLSLAIAGPLAGIVGLMPIIWIPGLISTIVGIICFFIPNLMKIEEQNPNLHLQDGQHQINDLADQVADR